MIVNDKSLVASFINVIMHFSIFRVGNASLRSRSPGIKTVNSGGQKNEIDQIAGE